VGNMSDTLEKGAVNYENTGPFAEGAPLTNRAKLGRHCRKRWWAYLIAFCLFVLVIMIIVVYGIIPPVAQEKLDKTVLHLNSLSVTKPSPNNFTVSLAATITGGGGIAAHAHLDPFDVVVFLEGHDPIQPIMTLPFGRVNGGNSVDVAQNNVLVKIGNEGAVGEFAKKLLFEKEMRVAMRGRTEMWLGKLHAGVNYNEVVTIQALNKLDGMAITNYTLLNEDRFNVGGKVLVPNPTVVTIEMGDVTLNIGLKDKSIGTGVISGLVLRPGNNSYDFKANVMENQLINLALAASQGGKLNVTSNGTKVDNVQIPWLSEPLTQLDTQVPFDISNTTAQ